MSEMVERVARAKWARRQEVGRKFGIDLLDWEGELETLREEVRSEVRCGFAAMREPTPKMIEAGGHEAFLENGPGVWREMIDAALK